MPRIACYIRAITILAMAGLAACGAGSSRSSSPTAAATASTTAPGSGAAPGSDGAIVTLKRIKFLPGAVSVKVGQVVTWRWDDGSVPHNVVADDASFKSGDPTSSGIFRATFDKPGRFAYHCDVHPDMTGIVTVE